jgi:hypothetical protein
LYWSIYNLKKVYQPRTNIVKDEKCDLVTDFHSILASGRNHFSQLLNIHRINDITNTELHTAKPIVHEPSAFEVELAIEKLKSDKSRQCSLRRGVGQFVLRSINLLFWFGIRRNCLRSGRNRSLYLFIRRAIK